MTERAASPDPHPGLVDRISAWLFPSLYPDVPDIRPCVAGPGQVYIGPCDRVSAEAEAQAGLEAEL